MFILSRYTIFFYIRTSNFGAVYKFSWCNCQASYIIETGRNLNIRLTEHKRAVKNDNINNDIAEHHLHTDHRIDWDSAECVTYSSDYYKRLILESCNIEVDQKRPFTTAEVKSLKSFKIQAFADQRHLQG